MKHLQELAQVYHSEQGCIQEQETMHFPELEQAQLSRPQRQEEKVHLLDLAAGNLLEQEIAQKKQTRLWK